MKKILIGIIFSFSFLFGFGQTFTPPRSSPVITVQDSRYRALLNFYMTHTHGINTNGGLDSLGMMFYEDSSGHIFYRDTILAGGHKWSMLLKQGDAGQGTVTKIIAGYGFLPITITDSGTLVLDTATLNNLWVRRRDSTTLFVTPTQMNAQGFLKNIAGITAGGDLAGTYVNPTIALNAVTFAKMQQIPGFTFIANPQASLANPQASYFGYGLRWNNDTVKVDTTTLKNIFGSASGSFITGAGNLSPLFTTGVSSNQITFTLSNAGAGTVFGNLTGSSGLPSFSIPTLTNIINWTGYIPQVALTTRGIGYRIFDPTSNGIKSLTCTGCTLDSSVSGQIGITVSGGGGGGTNLNVGSGYRWAIPGTNNIKTFFVSGGTLDSTTNSNALTLTIPTYQSSLSNTGSGFRVFTPSGSIRSLVCSGCTIDSTTNSGSLTFTITGGSGITQLTGDGTAGPGIGSQIFTLATVNSTPGSYGDNSHVATFTNNGKGLITNSGQTAIQITESQVTNLTTDLDKKIDTLYRTPGVDSIQFTIGGRFHEILDSLGGAASVLLPFYRVTDYGLTMAMSGTGTDVTSYIQAAINAAHAAGGGTVWMPQGVWGITSLDFTGKPDVSFIGSGITNTIFSELVVGDTMMKWNNNTFVTLPSGGGVFAPGYGYAPIRNFMLEGHNKAVIGMNCQYLYWTNWSSIGIDSCTVIGLNLKGSLTSSFDDFLIKWCPTAVYADTINLSPGGTVQPNLLTFNHPRIYNCTGWAFDIQNCGGSFTIGNGFDISDEGTAHNPNTGAIHLNKANGSSTLFIGPGWMEHNVGSLIRVENPLGNLKLNVKNVTIANTLTPSFGMYVNPGASSDTILTTVENVAFSGDSLDLYAGSVTAKFNEIAASFATSNIAVATRYFYEYNLQNAYGLAWPKAISGPAFVSSTGSGLGTGGTAVLTNYSSSLGGSITLTFGTSPVANSAIMVYGYDITWSTVGVNPVLTPVNAAALGLTGDAAIIPSETGSFNYIQLSTGAIPPPAGTVAVYTLSLNGK